jgi:hypothetical protein
MQQAVRALGWATKLLWILLIIIVTTIAYSATQINVVFGEPQTTINQQTLTISFPISIHNNGFYNIAYLNITTLINDQSSQTLARGTTYSRLIQRNTNTTQTHNIMINITKILNEHIDLILQDTTFTIFQYVSLNYAGAIPFSAYANQTMPWGAPLSNIAISQITYQAYNITHSIATVQLTFENHNQYIPVTGTTRIEIYNSNQALMGTGTGTTNAQPNSPGNAQVTVTIENSKITMSGVIRLFFETPLFSYGPITMPYNLLSPVIPYG